MSKTLLVTDDALIMREMIKDAAKASGWTIVGEATNGQEAIEQYAKHKPDVTTLDMVMPEYDGLHALHGIMKQDPKAKVLVVSALDQQDTLREVMKSGASDFIIKPFDKNRVVKSLEALVNAG